MNNVDKFFSDKLAGDQVTPSSQAWEKLDAHLSKKNKMVIWVRVAAAVAVVGLITFAVMNRDGAELEPSLAQQTPTSVPELNTTVTNPIDSVAQQKPAEIKQTSPSKSFALNKRQPSLESKEEIIPQEPQLADVAEPEKVIADTSIAVAVQEEKEKPLVLVYSLPTVNVPEPQPKAVSETETKTRLERVLQIAREVKNSDDALGELREAKDEILALDFKREKNKKQ